MVDSYRMILEGLATLIVVGWTDPLMSTSVGEGRGSWMVGWVSNLGGDAVSEGSVDGSQHFFWSVGFDNVAVIAIILHNLTRVIPSLWVFASMVLDIEAA